MAAKPSLVLAKDHLKWSLKPSWTVEIERAGRCAGPFLLRVPKHRLLRVADVKRVFRVARFAETKME